MASEEYWCRLELEYISPCAVNQIKQKYHLVYLSSLPLSNPHLYLAGFEGANCALYFTMKDGKSAGDNRGKFLKEQGSR